ncbi:MULTISPECIES: bestrophin family protein [Ramlibacter]|uniref:Multidrug transporter n=1 Tax=Ramlibacter pinisoli TaxID=2682844 RepID=A0A6N8IY75_9BURK|nr:MULTISPECIES: bestrophin family ion channel [Ramlibacter]MBA2961045.1 multidrug transporter [Ramlibacter sp. CGMCC 1.13660]MVQ30990.1 multidrug transporter [Ramlibacter pinisoli]
MHIGKSYRLGEFIAWTRRRLAILLLLSVLPVVLHQLAGWHWLALPWVLVAVLGAASSFIVGFKNAQTYGRTVEAQQVWTAIAAASRYWSLICRDFPTQAGHAAPLLQRHLAWLTALRFQLRRPRPWETAAVGADLAYRAGRFRVPEQDSALEMELGRHLAPPELATVMQARNKAALLLGLQSAAIRELYTRQLLVVLHHTEMQKTLRELVDQQARAERLKNFPYPRQYAIVNRIFVWTFAALLPFGLVGEFARLAAGAQGPVAAVLPWLAAPASLLVSWLYVSLDQVGASTENPFEGGANDVPITRICQVLAHELREMAGETDLPPLARPEGAIIL